MLKYVSVFFIDIVEILKLNIYKRICKCKVLYYFRIFRFLLYLLIYVINIW